MPIANPKNALSNAAGDLGITGGASSVDLDDEETKKKKLLEQQRNRMGMTGASVYGDASMQLFPGAGNGQ